MDDFLGQTVGHAEQITALSRKLIDEHKPGATLDESNPDHQQIMKLMEQARGIFEAGIRQGLGELGTLLATAQANLSRLEAGAAAAMLAAGATAAEIAAAGLPEAKPPEPPSPPVLALAFEEEHGSLKKEILDGLLALPDEPVRP